MTKHNIILPFLLLPLVMLFHACAIKDDIPYPIVESVVTAFEIEGQCNDTDDGEAEAVIDKKAQTVTVNVSDRVDLSALHILRFEASNDAQILPAPEGATFDFSSGTLPFTLRTYQDYDWKVNVSQIILRDVQMQGQVGDAVIDDYSRNVVVRVSADQDLHNIKVDKFSLAGQHGRVVPDPTASATYDFSEPRVFDAISAATGKAEQWTVYVYQTTAVEPLTVNVFMRSVSAVVSGSKPTGTTPVVEYRKQGDADWKTVPAGNVVSTARAYIAEATGLTPAVSYEFRVTAGSTTTETPQAQPTVAAQQLENGSFDNWSISGSGNNALYQPWGEGENSYWDTGNKGATTVGASNSTYVDSSSVKGWPLCSKSSHAL